MTEAICWYDHLNRLVSEQVEAAVRAAKIYLHSDKPDPITEESKSSATEESKSSTTEESNSGSVHHYLRQKCPACFGGEFGKSTSE
jgi:hypothetical protein